MLASMKSLMANQLCHGWFHLSLYVELIHASLSASIQLEASCNILPLCD